MYTSTSRRYKCSISDWIALVTGKMRIVLIWHYSWNKTELLSFHYIQGSPQTVLVFTNIYKDIGKRVSKFMLKCFPQAVVSNVVHIFDGFAYI